MPKPPPDRRGVTAGSRHGNTAPGINSRGWAWRKMTTPETRAGPYFFAAGPRPLAESAGDGIHGQVSTADLYGGAYAPGISQASRWRRKAKTLSAAGPFRVPAACKHCFHPSRAQAWCRRRLRTTTERGIGKRPELHNLGLLFIQGPY